jgi:hypothetical protein
MLIKTFHDDFGNTAVITKKNILPYKGSPQKQVAFILTLSADYENDFIYFVSMYETEIEAMEKLQTFSCNSWH